MADNQPETLRTDLTFALGHELSPMEIPVAQLFLDPANPRFAPAGGDTGAEGISDDATQRTLLKRIVKEFSLEPLMDSIEANGYLPIDRIVVREFAPNSYVVLEGNRRVAAVKEILRLEQTTDRKLDEEIRGTLLVLPALRYVGDAPNAAWIFQGIRHISGIKDWPAVNKARLLVDQMETTGANFTEAGRLFGLSRRAAGQYARAFSAYRHAEQHPDYASVVDERAFPFFQELFGQSNRALRVWMGWSDAKNEFDDDERFATFLSWLYPPPPEDDDTTEAPQGWDQRRIPRALDLRSVTDLLADNPHEFASFIQGTPLGTAVARARERERSSDETPKVILREYEEISSRTQKLPVVEIAESDVKEQFAAILEQLVSRLQSVLSHLQ